MVESSTVENHAPSKTSGSTEYPPVIKHGKWKWTSYQWFPYENLYSWRIFHDMFDDTRETSRTPSVSRVEPGCGAIFPDTGGAAAAKYRPSAQFHCDGLGILKHGRLRWQDISKLIPFDPFNFELDAESLRRTWSRRKCYRFHEVPMNLVRIFFPLLEVRHPALFHDFGFTLETPKQTSVIDKQVSKQHSHQNAHINWLVVTGTCFMFPSIESIGNFIIPTD